MKNKKTADQILKRLESIGTHETKTADPFLKRLETIETHGNTKTADQLLKRLETIETHRNPKTAGQFRKRLKTFETHENRSNSIVWMFQDHQPMRNFKIFHLGRVPGCQKAILIPKEETTQKTLSESKT